MGGLRHVQEGFVLDLPNEGSADTVLGGLCYSLDFVGVWNGGGVAPGNTCPAIVNGVVQVPVTAGAAAIPRGATLNLNLTNMTLELAGATDEDADGDGDNLVRFGRVIRGSLLANQAGTLWVKIKPQ